MNYEAIEKTMSHMVQAGKGILAADESNGTIGKRFSTIGVENTESNRRAYRLLLANTPDLENYINGVILFSETFEQTDAKGRSIAQIFTDKGILPGIKVDLGLVPMPKSDIEQVTQGLDNLTARLEQYQQLGAKFAKWRNIYTISEYTPSLTAIKTGAENLARYAAACQAAGIVPIVEPEIIMDGSHTIEQCAEVYEMVLHELFHSLFIHQVDQEYIILKPSMVTSGKAHKPFSTPEEVADYTISVFRNNVPAAVPTINFLSGGLSPTQACENLHAINQIATQPWLLSFSFGRALQEECLQLWQGKDENTERAQLALLKRARLTSAASLGEYSSAME